MGKARIIEALEDGEYWIALVYDKAPLIARRAKLEQQRAELLPKLADARHAADLAQAAAANARGVLDSAIQGEDDEWMQEAATAALQAGADAQAKETTWALLDAQHLSKTREIDTLTSAINVPDPVVRAWCADYTPDLAVDTLVGSIEIPDEHNPDRPLLIKPAWTDEDPQAGATWDGAADGCLMRANAQTIWQAYFNAVMLPALQHHAPRYRVAELLAIDEDGVGQVVIDRERSSASRNEPYQRFTTDAFAIDPPGAERNDQALALEAPIEYMDCDEAVFEPGDRVLVRFGVADWQDPLIIGFESNPKPCGAPGWYVLPASDDCPAGWGQPIDDEAGDIIPGTCGGPDPWQHIADSAEQTVRRGLSEPSYGNITWWGPETGQSGSRRRDVLSWQGPRSRYWPRYQTGAFNGEDKCDPGDGVVTCPSTVYRAGLAEERTTELQACRPYGVAIYRNGRHLVDAPLPVLGAAIQTPAEGERWLVAVCYDDQHADVVMRYPLHVTESPAWQTLARRTRPSADWFPPDAIWTFSEDGTEAATLRPLVYRLDIENGETDGEGNATTDSVYRHLLRLDVFGGSASFADEGRQYATGRAVYAVDYQGNDRAELLAHPLEDDTWLELRTPVGTVPILTASDALGVGAGDGFFVGSLSIDGGLKVDGVGTTAPLYRSSSIVYHLDLRDPAGIIGLVASEAAGIGRRYEVKSRVGGSWQTSYTGETAVDVHSSDWGGVLIAWSPLAGDPGEKVGLFIPDDQGDAIGEDVRSPNPPKEFAAGVGPDGRALLGGWWGYLAPTNDSGNPYGYHWSEGDPVTLLQIPGDAPRFHPLTYVGG